MTNLTEIEHPDCHLEPARPLTDQTAHEPDVAVDYKGRAWVVWSERSRDGERIKLKRFDDDGSGMTLSRELGIVLQPSIVALYQERILVVWSTLRGRMWYLESVVLESGRVSGRFVLPVSAEGFFRPRALSRGDGTALVAAEVVRGHSSSILLVRFDGIGWSSDKVETSKGDCFRPCLSPGPDRGTWLSYDCYREGRYDLFIQRIDRAGAPIAVAQNGFQNVQSDLAVDQDESLWIAWSSNENDREEPWWLTKYVKVVRFDGESFTEPVGEMPSRDVYNEDSWQGWEFPAIDVDESGRVWLFGQASHTLYAQYYDDSGWSERFELAPRRWGSWKPRIRVAGANPIYIVGMALDGAQAQRLNSERTAYRVPRTARPKAASEVAVAEAQPLDCGDHRPSTIDHRLPTTDHRLPTTDHRLPTTDHRPFFGDLHCHSVYGDAVNDVDEIYHRYRDAYGYDFAALTEHDYLDGMELSHSERKMMWSHADRMTKPDEFVALYGYEWTSPALADHAGPDSKVGEGHRHIIYPDQSGPLVSYGEESARTGAGLLDRLRGARALVIQHHTGWSGTDWNAYDPELSRLIEICSTHGRFEYEDNRPIGYRRDHVHPGQFVVDGLNRGLKFGFVGGSDSHGLLWHATEMEGRSEEVPAGTRVGWKEDSFRTGMTAILAPELTREALFDALYHRRCYATSGVPIELDFRINGEPMGSEITVEDRPRISVRIVGTAELDMIHLVRSGKAFFARAFGAEVRSHDTHIEMIDTSVEPGEPVYYYVRVIQRDGNMAWSSPIWVEWEV